MFKKVLLICFEVTRKHGMTKRAPVVEQGTTKTGEVDFEWIPRDVLNSMFIHLILASIFNVFLEIVVFLEWYNIESKYVDCRQEVAQARLSQAEEGPEC